MVPDTAVIMQYGLADLHFMIRVDIKAYSQLCGHFAVGSVVDELEQSAGSQNS